ncbi:Uncharacterised protein [Mycolicibacterium phlei]|uniref:Uncharacterized protein n=1 Tax=Mycolicibacterium phlei DSM 43239 = CCUG 21000 TaxID=1226750 RepID=A0A5N5V6B1_MYCPH|nr:hypothetical protein [Mycolicibacterium phlei]VEG10358.1 Uncharacterised protein [Mycobacteroides chelonae]AMO62254.1 hypothetical protein MPHLCCUG_03453 [Mycolicibacterium phlei]KAB7757411.1 hypothetical protein MPHL21000_07950 [Mycolicibacterium phlei DSM 43239 = CCUG 21000]KXW66308.1 hypothetical protein MPHL43239_08535 [Mycolicibacterium phlei DSM 43239 = CCUG 21000]KXW70305.1 hypothetical protein MPHL43072_19370 [Mycolicibacterium phlei DSM 43072]
MTSSNIRARRLVAAGAFAVAAVAAPFAASVLTTDVSDVQAGPACLAWFGNKEDGKCLSYSNGNGINVGTPDIGIYGPNTGSLPGGGIGVSSGPLLPGTSWNQGIGIN